MSKPAQPSKRPRGLPVPDAHKHAIAASVASGKTQAQVAAEFGVHRNSVSSIIRQVHSVLEEPAQASWRAKFDDLPGKCVDAIEAAITDKSDTYRAAAIAQTHFKGVGVYASDSSSTNIFVGQIATLPADWTSQFVTAEPTTGAGLSGRDSTQE